jgi:outer membrane receptor protein involved in Fe transport
MRRSIAFSSALLATTALSATPAAAQDAAAESEVIVVRGEFIPQPQRATSQVATFLTESDLARAGDANAAVALTRLSGLSIVSDRFAYVRGLGERYSLALLNGSPLPSPEPLRRTVPLDLFPADLLGGITVQKTYSANYPGDFGGGVIELRTLREARENYFETSVGVGFNSVTVEEDGIFVRGGDTDWTGYDDGLRQVPAPLRDVLASDMRLNEFDDETIELAGESLVNSPLSVIQESDLDPSYEGAIEAGWSFDTERFSLGLVGVAGYESGWTTANKVRQIQQGGVLGGDLISRETTFNADAHALGSAALLWGEQSFQTTLFYTHSTSKEAQIDAGFDFNAPGGTGEVWDESTGWFERELAMGQLSGDHVVGPFNLSWRGAAAVSTRDAPYERSLRRLVNADGEPAYLQANNYTIRFTDLEDTIISGGADLGYELDFGGGREATFTVGVDSSSTERDYDLLSLRFAGGNSLPADVQVARPDFLFSPDNIDPTRFVLQEIVTPNDSYSATLDINAAYAQADLEVIPYVRTTLGVRYEEAEETVDTFDRFGNPGAGGVTLENEYVLPSALVTWNFAQDLQLRLGYSQTIARPQFRELAQSNFIDPETDRSYRGNRGLVDSELTNYDARLEYYLGRDAFVTLAGFHKKIDNPIEEAIFSTSTFEFETTFINSPASVLSGGEFEFRKYFQSPIDRPWLTERNWLLAFNYAYTKSQVQADPGDQVFDPIAGGLRDASLFVLDGSPLQGSPENIANLQTGWQSPNDEFTILLGWVDERILQRGTRQPGAEVPDVIEDPGIQLDLNYRLSFEVGGAELTLGISGRNLLDEQHVEYQQSEALMTSFNTYDRGRSVSVSVSSRF